jgi:hypothetical protein
MTNIEKATALRQEAADIKAHATAIHTLDVNLATEQWFYAVDLERAAKLLERDVVDHNELQ